MNFSGRAVALLALLALILAACTPSTSLRSAWYDSSFVGGPMKRILVVGVAGNLTDRRVFDDLFAKALKEAGVEGIPGYQFIDSSPTTSLEASTQGWPSQVPMASCWCACSASIPVPR
jgi:hypothetical protein